jgi:hypothetical protein
VTVESYLKDWNSEKVAYEVLRICRTLEDDDSKLVRQLWSDREFLLMRVKILAEDCETEGDHNTREEIGRWARKGYEAVV